MLTLPLEQVVNAGKGPSIGNTILCFPLVRRNEQAFCWNDPIHLIGSGRRYNFISTNCSKDTDSHSKVLEFGASESKRCELAFFFGDLSCSS